MSVGRILVVDDEVTIALIVAELLEDHGCEVETAHSAEEGLKRLDGEPFDVALLDIVLPGMSGLRMLGKVKERSPTTEVLMMTSQSSVESVLEAVRHGAYDYLQKPFNEIEEVWFCIERVLHKSRLERANRELLEDLQVRNEELTASLRRQTSLIEAGKILAQRLTLPDLLDCFLGLLVQELGVGRASLMLLKPGTEDLTIAAQRGLDEVDLGSVVVKLGEGIAGGVAKSGEPFLATDVRGDDRVENARDDLANSFMSAPITLSIPIRSGENSLGVINATNRGSNAPFDAEDLAYLTGLAGQLAVAVERARQFDDLEVAFRTQQRTQEQLVVAERHNAVGQMAAGVAHDFNNALGVIVGRTEQTLAALSTSGTDPARIRSNLEAILHVSEVAAKAVRRIQDYTRIRVDRPHESVDMVEVVRSAVEMTRPKWDPGFVAGRPTIEMNLDLTPVSPVVGDFQELEQVVNNLLFNAVEAMPDGGRLSFHSRDEDGDVVLEVSDTGVGMEEATRARLFEPFFTTKAAGNGLGTSVMLGIVERHSGTIEVETEPERGSLFRIRLPRGNAVPVAPSSSLASIGSSAGRILLVDDDEMLRTTVMAMLGEVGHHVVEAASGEEALQLFAADTFHLALVDLNMPGMGGLATIEALRNQNDRVLLGVLSGTANLNHDSTLREAGADFTLTKPCRMAELLGTVAHHLEQKERPAAP